LYQCIKGTTRRAVPDFQSEHIQAENEYASFLPTRHSGSTRQVSGLRLLDLRGQLEFALRHLHLAELAVDLAQQKMRSVAVRIEGKSAQQRPLRLLIAALAQ